MGNRSGGQKNSEEKRKSMRSNEEASVRPEEVKTTYATSANNGKLNNVATPGGEQYFIRSSPVKAGAVPYKFGEFNGQKNDKETEDKKIEVILYRSYRSLNKFGSKYGVQKPPSPDIKYYRRSTQSLSKLNSTMPRSTSMASHGEMQSKSNTAPRGVSRSKSAVDGELYHPNNNRNQILIKGKLEHSNRSDIYSNSKINTLNPVTSEDFPSIIEVKNRRALFENRYIRCLRDLYTSLPADTQLKALCLAMELPTHPDDGPPSELSLHDYFADPSRDVSDRNRYRLCVPQSMGVSVSRARADVRKWGAAGVDLLTSLASEVAGELSRVFEYQIAMLRERAAVELLARHAAECGLHHTVQSRRSIRRNHLCHGVCIARPSSVNHAPRCSVMLGDNEFKWDLYAVFKLPGLRVDLKHSATPLRGETTPLSRGDTPLYAYYSADEDHDSAKYGYRASFVDWDVLRERYTFNQTLDTPIVSGDQSSLDVKQALHRRYKPYCRLVGGDTVIEYLDTLSGARTSVDTSSATLGEFVGRGREVKVFYRPIYSQPSLEGSKLQDVDLTRIIRNRRQMANGEEDGEEQNSREAQSPFSDTGRTSNDSGTGESVIDTFERVDSNDNVKPPNDVRIPRKSCLKKSRDETQTTKTAKETERQEMPRKENRPIKAPRSILAMNYGTAV